jgi:tetratricopeptide (TPR) repeat protein
MSALLIAIGCVLVLAAPTVSAGVVELQPDGDNTVVVTLPASQRDPDVRSAITARAVAASPVASLARARTLLEAGRRRNDVRLVDLAASLLDDSAYDVDAHALRLRAAANSWRHEFDAARRALLVAVRVLPDDGELWFALAGVERVRGALDAAVQACERAHALRPSPLTALCLADLASLRGDGPGTARWLARAGPTVALDDDTSGWRMLTRARIAARSGDPQAARQAYARALLVADGSVLASYSRWALENGEAQRVVRLLDSRAGVGTSALDDDLAVSLAIALQRSGWSERARALSDSLEQRFVTAEATGLPLHWGARARRVMAFDDDPARALEYAERNWRVQRETDDARLLARAALAARDVATLEELGAFVRASGLSDQTLGRLLAAGDRA